MTSSLGRASGGTSAAVAGLADSQCQTKKVAPLILTNQTAKNDPEVVSNDSRLTRLEVVRVPFSRFPLRWHPQLARIVGDVIEKSDIVHVHALWEEIQVCAVKNAIRKSKPFLLSPHGMLDPWSLSQSKWKKKLYWNLRWRPFIAKASAVHFITASEKRLASNALPYDIPSIVSPLGIEPVSYWSTNRRLDAPTVLFLSRLHPKKNLEFLLSCLEKFGNGSSIRMVVAGSGDLEYKAKLEGLTNTLGLSNRVEFVGDVAGNQKRELFLQADIFCLPSYQENFGIVVAEALSYNLPVIISPQVGLAEDLTGKSEVDIVPLQEELWINAIKKRLGERDRRAYATPTWVTEMFNWGSIGAKWIDEYERIIAEHKYRKAR